MGVTVPFKRGRRLLGLRADLSLLESRGGDEWFDISSAKYASLASIGVLDFRLFQGRHLQKLDFPSSYIWLSNSDLKKLRLLYFKKERLTSVLVSTFSVDPLIQFGHTILTKQVQKHIDFKTLPKAQGIRDLTR